MRNFLLVLIIVILIPVVVLMGVQGLSANEVMLKLGIKKDES